MPLNDLLKKPHSVLTNSSIYQRTYARRQDVAFFQSLAHSFMESASLEKGVSSTLEAICEHYNWDLGILWLADENQVLHAEGVWANHQEISSDVVKDSNTITFAPGYGWLGRGWQERRSIWSEDVQQEENFARINLVLAQGLHTALAVPVATQETSYGMLELFSREQGSVPDRTVSLMEWVGEHLGSYIHQWKQRENQQAVFKENSQELVRVRAEEEDRTFLLYYEQELQAQRLDYRSTVDAMVKGLLEVANCCALYLYDDNAGHQLELVAGAQRGTSSVSRLPLDRVDEVIKQGVIQTFYPDELEVTIVPLISPERALGAMVLGPTERIQERDHFFENIQSICAHAIENIRLYVDRALVAHHLQKSLLPAALPTAEGLQFQSLYRAAGAGEVGGDFYDVFPCGGGWMVVIGDVMGKGPQAAAVTSLARSTIQVGALLYPESPKAILTLLNQALITYLSDRFCTVQLILFCPEGDRWKCTITNGGHLPPLRIGNESEYIEVEGLLVGVIPEAVFQERTFYPEPGDRLLLYTDGITEARIRGEMFGEDRLKNLAVSIAQYPLDQMLGHIERRILQYQHRSPSDDIALLGIQVGTPPKNCPTSE